MTQLKNILVAPLLVFALISPKLVNAQPVKLSGSVTIVKIIEEKKAQIEAQAGTAVVAIPSQTALGLVHLCTGEAEVALVGGPVAAAAKAANVLKPGAVDASALKTTTAKTSKIVFAVNPANPVASLTKDQLVGILSGKIRDWKDVGGTAGPIQSVVAKQNNGWRITIEHLLLGDTQIVEQGAIVQDEPRNIPTIVAQLPTGIGFFASSLANDKVKVLTTDAEIPFELNLVTKGDPQGQVAKVVEAVAAALK